MVYMLTGMAFMTVQSLLLRVPAIRAKFGILPIPENAAKPYTMLESYVHLRKYIQEQREQAERDMDRRL